MYKPKRFMLNEINGELVRCEYMLNPNFKDEDFDDISFDFLISTLILKAPWKRGGGIMKTATKEKIETAGSIGFFIVLLTALFFI